MKPFAISGPYPPISYPYPFSVPLDPHPHSRILFVPRVGNQYGYNEYRYWADIHINYSITLLQQPQFRDISAQRLWLL